MTQPPHTSSTSLRPPHPETRASEFQERLEVHSESSIRSQSASMTFSDLNESGAELIGEDDCGSSQLGAQVLIARSESSFNKADSLFAEIEGF